MHYAVEAIFGRNIQKTVAQVVQDAQFRLCEAEQSGDVLCAT